MMKIKKRATILLAIISMFAISIPTMASGYLKTIYLLPNQVWTDRYDHTGVRTGSYSYVDVTCHSVYPESGRDTYSKMQVRLADTYGNDLSSIYTIKEATGANKVYLLEGYLNITNIYYEFRGNSSSDAYASVTYEDK